MPSAAQTLATSGNSKKVALPDVARNPIDLYKKGRLNNMSSDYEMNSDYEMYGADSDLFQKWIECYDPDGIELKTIQEHCHLAGKTILDGLYHFSDEVAMYVLHKRKLCN